MSPAITLLIAALIRVESGGNDRAVGDDGRALGCLQITMQVVVDVNRFQTKWHFTSVDRLNRDKSILIARLYLEHWCNDETCDGEPTVEQMARCWNGGPGGWKKAATLPHWEKVQAELLEGVHP